VNGLAVDRDEGQTMPATTIELALKAHIDTLMAVPGVVGVGQGLLENTPCIKVFVVEKTPELQRQLPKILDGHPVVIEQTGRIKALPKGSVP
jgi:hypothetical protein